MVKNSKSLFDDSISIIKVINQRFFKDYKVSSIVVIRSKKNFHFLIL